MVKKMKKVFPVNIVVDKNICASVLINNSFAIKNYKILHFKDFNRASHLNDV